MPQTNIMSDAIVHFPRYEKNFSSLDSMQKMWIIAANNVAIRLYKISGGQLKPMGRISLLGCTRETSPRCWAQQKNKILLQYNPGLYLTNNPEESINPAQKISVRMDEALWQDHFDSLIIIAETNIAKILYHHLSQPVQARTRFLKSTQPFTNQINNH